MDWGLENRLSRIIRRDGHTVMLAVDHGYFLGPTLKIENPRKTIVPLLPYTDAVMPTRGVLRSAIPPGIDTPIVLRVSGGNSIVGTLSNEDIITSMKDAVRLNVVAVAFSIHVGTEYEHQTLTGLAKLVDEGQEYGMPVVAVTAVGRELEKREARYLALCCRIAAEIGANIVKTYYCENFEKVVEGCPVPIVIAGGPKLETELDVFNLVYNAVQMGAAGVDMGRNIWQNDHPIAMIKAIRAIVHEGANVKEACELFSSLKQDK
ncbi:MAG: 3-hydroxy-5-phosphonooxypentane-2,4-dione thiolase [Candidatus Bathyarchaeota archaeon]